MPKVSIIIPVYNVEKYLRQCLDSVISQTFKDIEIIVVNDCSPDNSLQIIKEYQKKDERIVLIDLKENVGLGSARNEGMKVANGKYIIFVDSDDWCSKDCIDILLNNIEKYRCDVFVASFSIYTNVKIYYHKHPNFILKYKSYKTLLLFPITNTVPVWAKIYKKEFLQKNKLFFCLRQKQDSLFLYELILANPKIIFNNTSSVYFYRNNRKNSITNINNKYYTIYGLIKLFKRINKLLISKNRYKEYLNTFYIFSFLYTAYEITIIKLPNKKMQKILLIIKKNILVSNKLHNYNLSFSNKIISFIFEFFLNHYLIFRFFSNFLKILKRIYFKNL